MPKNLLFYCIALMAMKNVFADNIHTTIEINGVIVQGGAVYVAVYSNENDYKNGIKYYSFVMQPVKTTLIYNMELPAGDYVVSCFQDINNNGELDTYLFGIPKEPVGITNYNGRGIPGGFKKLKVPVNNTSAIITVSIGNAG